MTVIYSNNTDGPVRNYGETTWNAAHDSDGTSGTAVYHSADQHPTYCSTVTAGSSGANPDIVRGFFAFDISGISVAPSSATFYVYASTGGGDVIAVKATAPGLLSNIAAADFNNLTGWTSGFTNSNLTAYSAKRTSQGDNTLWSITLNSTALSDMGSSDTTLQICLMNYDHDYLDVAPTSTISSGQHLGIFWSEYVDAARRPRIEYVAGGYSHEISGVASSNIGNVIGVASAGIASRSDVDT